MAVQTSYPGVYVQEVPSGVRTIAGVSTSIALFIGTTLKGPINKPIRCPNYTSFQRTFGDGPGTSQLPLYVRLFFINGGTDCYVLRVAQNPASSTVTLRNEANTADALILEAKDEGISGENIRAIVSYTGPQPEATFTLELYLWDIASGVRTKTRREIWRNLSMNPASSNFAPDFITQNSQLVNAELPGAPAAATQGFSQSGRPVQHQASPLSFRTAWAPLIGNGANNKFNLTLDGRPPVLIDLNNPVLDVALMPAVAGIRANLAAEIKTRIQAQFALAGQPGVVVTVDFVVGPTAIGPATQTTQLRISSTTNGDVYIRPGGANDLAIPLMLGTEQGGLEISSRAIQRPAPSGITLRASDVAVDTALAGIAQSALAPPLNGITLDVFNPPPAPGTSPLLVNFPDIVTTVPADLFYQDANGAASKNGNNDGVREKLTKMANAINTTAASNPLFKWTAQVSGYRLTILPTDNVDDNFLGPNFGVTGFGAGNFLNNVHAYTLGGGGLNIGARQVAGITGSDGTAPLASDYSSAYNNVVDREVDLFNLMVLPPDDAGAVTVDKLYGEASDFCQKRRAFLIMDPLDAWADAQTAVSGIPALRIGLVKDYSAIYFPDITVRDNSGLTRNIGPAGALAGLYARIDGTRGVWKAPAGIEADLRGIVGLKQQFSDAENGTLNPRAINTNRQFPSGIVSWGARTNFGDDDTPHDYKYVPVRRTALFIEESLYRGLKWVVFEPNDEPLWAQIRLNVGAFMQNLFRQGAFQGTKKVDAYFVKCDNETTTQNDINLGIVNIWVGFAPLKPAEFVILYLQQMAGNIQV